ncbi:MAG TPA: TIGR00269 family protein, partial [Candidatus Nanoarchaeia archaeon]|nr:TIGR00269 family protein [Candidatus Nanoarchaeia archaeon]
GVEAIAIDEGIKGYRDKSLLKANELCGKLGINLNVFSYKEEFGMELDEILKVLTIKPCSICGVFRRYLLNKKSRELGFTLLATGHNLDDEAQSIMMNQMKNNVSASARLGPKVGIIEDSRFVQRIKPLYFCTEKEVTTYAFINGLMDDFNECPNAVHSYRAGIRDMLNDFENKFAGTKHSIVNSFLETLPLLQKQYTQNHIEIKSCDNCGEPSAKEICSACNYAERLKQKAELSQIKK